MNRHDDISLNAVRIRKRSILSPHFANGCVIQARGGFGVYIEEENEFEWRKIRRETENQLCIQRE